MYLWYKFFSYLFYFFAPIYLYFRKLNKKEDDISYKEKLSIISSPRGEGFLIWFHVASVGEAMSILPLVESFVENQKVKKILITSITLSSGKILKKKFYNNLKITHQFLPLDIPIFTKKFINYWKPNLSIFIDSEIWPNLILKINSEKIPLLLINARISKKTFKRWKFFSNFAKKIFEKFDLCIASNKESENYLLNLGVKKVKNFGNLKFSNIKNNLNNTIDNQLYNKIKNRKIWCAASTHAGEEVICAKTHMEIKKKHKEILTIIIPRHIDRVEKIKKKLSEFNLNIAYYSQSNLIDSKTDIILIDSYGETLKFYNISKYVFLGKSLIESLKVNSGQNPIEPARLGCKIFHGPYVKNFEEIYDYLKTLSVTEKVNNSDELSNVLKQDFNDNKEKNHEIAKKIDNYGQNIFNNVIIELKKYI